MIACEKCDALNPKTAAACEECGAALAAAATPPPVPPPPVPPQPMPPQPVPPPLAAEPPAPPAPPRASRRQRDADKVERSRQRQEFARIKSTVFTIRSVYWASVAFAVVQLLIYHLILKPVLDELEVGNLLLLLASWGQLALMTAGSLLVVRQPFLWAVLGASWWTASTGYIAYVYMWLMSELENAPSRIRGDPVWDSLSTRAIVYLSIMTLVVVAFWFAAAQARRIEELMKLNPELELERRRRAVDDTPEQGIAESARSRRRSDFQRSNAAALRVILIAVTALLVLGGGAWWWLAPPGAEHRIEEFERHWNAGDVDAMVAMIDGASARAAARLPEDFARRGWKTQPPALGERELDVQEQRADVAWSCDDDRLVVRWTRDGEGRWFVYSYDLPELKTPPIDDAIAAFRAAWGAPGTDALTAMVEPDSERVARGVVRLLEARDLAERRDALGEVDAGRRRGARQTVLFGYGTSEVRVTFEYRHPRWWIAGFRAP